MATQPKSGTSGGATPPQPCHTSGLANSFILPRLLFTAPYVLVLLWFRGVDVYHRHFSEPGLIVLAYNSFRVLFIFYLFCIIETAGLFLLRAVAGNAVETIGILERLALGFFTGAGVWHVAMFALGYLNLYTWPIAIAISLPLVALSYGDVRVTAGQIQRAISGGAVRRNLGPGPLGWILLGLASLAFIMLLLVKGLYPGGGHDYFTHYFYYFQTVIARGGLWPNDVWYHYYYDKGAGLYFLGTLITDPLAPQLVTFCFMALATLALFLLLHRVAPGTLWPLVGVALYLCIYVYTPSSTSFHRVNGGWGEFEKTHEIIAALVIVILWMIVETLSCPRHLRVLWSTATVSVVICAVIVDNTIAVFLGGIFLMLTLSYAVRRRTVQLVICFGLSTVTGAALFVALVINQSTTGLSSDQEIELFWKFADVETLYRWGALPFVMILHHDRMAMTASSLPLTFQTVRLVVESLRLELLVPLVFGGLLVALPTVIRKRYDRKAATEAAVFATALLAFTLVAILVGRAQPISFYRYASFATALTLASGVLLWNIADVRTENFLTRIARSSWGPTLVLALCLATDIYPLQTYDALNRALHFATGRYSIDTAYSMQYGPEPRLQWSAINPGSRGAYEAVGPHTRIWSLHIHLYCMLPDCRVETYPAVIMTRDWDQLMFGSPDAAKQILRAAHLDYFLYSREYEIADPLPLSPLFSPDNIGHYFGIRWTDGTSYLLTWLGPNVQPLDRAWLADYRTAVQRSETVRSFPYNAMKQAFVRLGASQHPWQHFRLPWEGN
jgi:hypothetical protein